MPSIERRPIVSISEWLAWRRQDVTASVVGALFGVHEYKTIFGLHADVTGCGEKITVESGVMERGRDFETGIAKRVAREHPEWKIRSPNAYFRDPALRLGATPDFLIRSRTGHRGVLQVKLVNPFSFRRRWTPDLAPQWIVLQTLVEMILTRATFGVIAAYESDGYGTRALHYYDVSRHAKAEKRIRDAVTAFWRAVDQGEMPKPDYGRDGSLIAAMYPTAKPGSTVDLRHDNRMPEILSERAKLKAEIDAKEKALKALDAEIKDKLGENEAALCTGWSVTLKQINVNGYTKEVAAYSYRKLDCKRDEAAPEPEPAKQENAA